MSTKAQKWAQERNWLKFMLMGLRTPLRYSSRYKAFTKTEQVSIDKASTIICELIRLWDSNNTESKKQYLRKVKN